MYEMIWTYIYSIYQFINPFVYFISFVPSVTIDETIYWNTLPNSVIPFGFFDMIFVKNTEAYILGLFKWSTDRMTAVTIEIKGMHAVSLNKLSEQLL